MTTITTNIHNVSRVTTEDREIAPPGDADFPSGLRVQRFTFHDPEGRPFLTISAFSPESESAPTIERVSP